MEKDQRRSWEGKGRPGQGIEDLNAGRGFSYRMPPITRDQIRARGTAVSCFIVFPSGKLCYNNYDYCLFLADSIARCSNFVPQQVYNMIHSATDLKVPESGG